MNFKHQKSSAIALFSLALLLAGCAEPPNFAPVKTVNQALEPNNGYYLRNKPDKIPVDKQSYNKKTTETITTEAKKIPNSSNKTLSKSTQLPEAKNADNAKNTEKSNFMASVTEKKEVSKPLKSIKSTEKAVDQNKNKLIISKTKDIGGEDKQSKNTKSADYFLLTPAQNKKSSISIDNKKVLKLNFQWPLKGKITRNFSQTDNKGILIKGKTGQAVHAAESGKAVYCGHGLTGFGNLAIIKHNETYLSAYANNSKLFIKEGERVEKGQTIGQVGPTGLRSSSLHFEIRKNGKPINPLNMLPKP